MELTASGIEVAAARNVTLETIVGICAENFCNANMSEASSHIKSQTAKVCKHCDRRVYALRLKPQEQSSPRHVLLTRLNSERLSESLALLPRCGVCQPNQEEGKSSNPDQGDDECKHEHFEPLEGQGLRPTSKHAKCAKTLFARLRQSVVQQHINWQGKAPQYSVEGS